MNFHARTPSSPSEVLAKLAAMPDGATSSWAGAEVLASSLDRLYVRVNGERFAVSPTAGATVFTVVGQGEVAPAATGSIVSIRFRYGPFASSTMPLLLALALGFGGYVAWQFGEAGTGAVVAAFLPALAVGVCWVGGRSAIRWTLGRLSPLVGAWSWEAGLGN